MPKQNIRYRNYWYGYPKFVYQTTYTQCAYRSKPTTTKPGWEKPLKDTQCSAFTGRLQCWAFIFTPNFPNFFHFFDKGFFYF